MKTKKGICPPNKFGFGSRCVTWLYILCIFALFAAIIICTCIYFDKVNITRIHKNINQDNTGLNNLIINSSSNESVSDNLIRYIELDNIDISDIDSNSNRHSNNHHYSMESSNGKDINININVPTVEQHRRPNINQISYPDYLHQKNHERVINPLLPPERSYENTYGVPINIPTRGSSGGFQQIGMLYKQDITDSSATIGNNSETAVFPLYGRPLYPGSNKWSYYTASDKFNSVKMPISHNGRRCDADYGCHELYNGDIIQIPAYNGDFKVEIYDYDKPRYIPYVY
jgi:hypothetical protein